MRFVPQKSVQQQDLQCQHRVRSRLVACRTQLVNQIRGLLAGYGIVLPQHVGQLRSGLPAVLEDAENQLPGLGRQLFRGLYEELAQLEVKINAADHQIQLAFQGHEDCRRIGAVEGIDPLTATVIAAAISNGLAFANGRQFAAWLGLVPRQNSSGGKTRLIGIGKRGDPATDNRITVWEVTQHLIHRLDQKGQDAAAELVSHVGGLTETARELANRLYTLCERKGRAEEAGYYNALVVAWTAIRGREFTLTGGQ